MNKNDRKQELEKLEEPAEDTKPEDTTTTDGEYVYDREQHIAEQEAENNSMWEEYKKKKAARKAAEVEGLMKPAKKCRY